MMKNEQKADLLPSASLVQNGLLAEVGLPIHATNEDNTYTFCGLKVNKSMSYHRGGIMLGMIINGEKYACKECLSHCC